MLSKLPADIPCRVIIAKNKVKTIPTLHLKKLEMKELNLSSFTLSEKFEIISKTKLNINNGIIK